MKKLSGNRSYLGKECYCVFTLPFFLLRKTFRFRYKIIKLWYHFQVDLSDSEDENGLGGGGDNADGPGGAGGTGGTGGSGAPGTGDQTATGKQQKILSF